jgi:hypothetical protein
LRVLQTLFCRQPNFLPVLNAYAVFFPYVSERHIILNVCHYVGEDRWLEWSGALERVVSPVALVKSVTWMHTDRGQCTLAKDVKVCSCCVDYSWHDS